MTGGGDLVTAAPGSSMGEYRTTTILSLLVLTVALHHKPQLSYSNACSLNDTDGHTLND